MDSAGNTCFSAAEAAVASAAVDRIGLVDQARAVWVYPDYLQFYVGKYCLVTSSVI